jgi:hypothetical protein
MKLIFIGLVIANALVFALWQGLLPNPLAVEHVPKVVVEQKNPQLLRVISEAEATATVKSDATSCLEWGAFVAGDVNAVDAALKPLSLGGRLSRVAATDTRSTMVYIPPLENKALADKKVVELARLGVKDFYIIQDPPELRWGISLGVFKSDDAAKQFLANLVSKGVHSAKLRARPMATTKFNYVFKDVSEDEISALEKLTVNFPGRTLRGCG